MIQTLFGNPEKETKPGLFDRMKQAVTRTRDNLSERIDEIASFGKQIDQDTLDDLESSLLSSDLGMPTTRQILDRLRERATHKQIKDVSELKTLIKQELLTILRAAEGGPLLAPSGEPVVIMVVGVNGTGKTTTIGKLAYALKTQGHSVLICACDTFRAAAIEQVQIWAERTGAEFAKAKAGGDPASILFDALQSAKSKKIDYVIVDTAGRLHTKQNLMAELAKMKRTAERIIPAAPQEIFLVMDAVTGQNGLQQTRQFTEAVGITGIVLTKLDGTAKGGVVVAISRELAVPVRYIGIGEAMGDLLPFDPEAFVNSLFE